ncbi:hypothetical protein RND81_09G012500 [Saponaria officinalis]|uniref:SIAH-type domain-containing protein n=1 Tax=Saponaria officinalis TaxID=3572 RepID=A0AAW1IGG9_SAPOF
MVTVVVSNLDDVQCFLCLHLPIPPIYHCRDNHVICSRCRENIGELCTSNDCGFKIQKCENATFMLSNIEFECPNKKNGCTLTLSMMDVDAHVRECHYSKCCCPVCADASACEDVHMLKGHMEDHNPRKIIANEESKLIIADGQKCLLQEELTEDFFLLKLDKGILSLQHMWWGEPRSHHLCVVDSENGDSWDFMGNTSEVLSNSKVLGNSGPITQVLQIPYSIFAGDEPITCELVIGKKPETQAVVATITGFDEKEQGLCRVCYEIASPQVYHCEFNHIICTKCRNSIGGECGYCFTDVMICQISTNILRECRCICPKSKTNCPQVPIQDYEAHATQCSKYQFACPICSEGFEDVVSLKNHLSKNICFYERE